MAVSAQEKVDYFKHELAIIHDRKVREFCSLCVTQAPDYVYENCPSSSSGKYHPVDELSADGTLIHTKKVFTMAYEMTRGFDCDNNRDLVLTAAIVHDLRKYGVGNGVGHTLPNHPDLAAQLVVEVQEATQLLSEYQCNIIRCCVGYHYGPWSIDPWKKPIEEYTREELTLYMSDFTVSKRFIQTDYRRV